MNRKQFENKLADKFDDFSPEYEANSEMWRAISSELPKKKNRRKIILLPLFLFGLIGFLFWQSYSVKEIINSDIAFDKVNTNRITQIINEEALPNTTKTKSLTVENNDTQLINNKTNINLTKQIGLDRRAEAFTSISNKNKITSVATPDNHNLVNAWPSQTSIFIAPTVLHLDSAVNAVQSQNRGSTMTARMPLMPLNKFTTENEMMRVNEFNLPLLIDTASAIAVSEIKQSRFSAGVTLGVSKLRTGYELNDDRYASVVENRKNSENADLQLFTGLQLEYDLTSNWSIQSGLNFYHFQDQSARQSTSIQIDTVEGFQRVEQTTAGADTTIMGTAFITNTTNTESLIYTNRQILTIPIVVVYTTPLSAKSKLGIGVGLEKTIFTRIRGSEEDLDDSIYDLTLDSESRYGNHGLYGLLRLMYTYELTNKWDLRIESNYKHELRSNFNTDAPIKKSFHAVGLAISTQLKF